MEKKSNYMVLYNNCGHYKLKDFYASNFEKVEGAYCFGLIRSFVRPLLELSFINRFIFSSPNYLTLDLLKGSYEIL